MMHRVLLILGLAAEAAGSEYPSGGGGGGGYGGGSSSYGGGSSTAATCDSWGPCCNCPQACTDWSNAEIAKNGWGGCSEWDYSQTGSWTYCSSSCNSAICNRQNGICTIEDALEGVYGDAGCIELDNAVPGLNKAPKMFVNDEGLMNVTIGMKIGQMKLEMTDAPDPTFATIPVHYNISWQDWRWALTTDVVNASKLMPNCRDLMAPLLQFPTKLGMPPDELAALNIESKYFLPKLKVANNKATPATTSASPPPPRQVTYNETLDHLVQARYKLNPTFTQLDLESDTPYYAFPFDIHTIYAKFEAKPAATILGCSGSWSPDTAAGKTGVLEKINKVDMVDMAALDTIGAEEMEKLLPPSGEWTFDPDSSTGPVIKMYLEPESPEICTIEIRVRRNPFVYTLKAFLPDMVVMAIGMSALFINPAIPPLFGGRCSILILAMLITMNSSLNRNNGLGKLSYLTKIDYVALLNLVMLLFAMGCSIIVHQMFRFEKLRLGVLLDKAVRFSLPSVIFPGVQIFEYLFLANADTTGPLEFLIVYMAVSFSIIIVYFVLVHMRELQKLAKMSEKLKRLDLSNPEESNRILQEAFELFDADKSGALDAREGRKLLMLVNPGLKREAVAKALREADRLGNGIVEDDFQSMIMQWAADTPEDGAWTGGGGIKKGLHNQVAVAPVAIPPPADGPAAANEEELGA